MATITHFMIPAEDLERAKKFYTEIFGWKIKKLPGPMEYYEIETDGLGGGMARKDNPDEKITNYIDVPSIDKYAAKIEKLGGKITVPKAAVLGTGYVAICMDTENNVFGLWETDENAR